jgi:hypothetical protein
MIKCLIVMALALQLHAQQFNRDEILGLSQTERVELFQKLNPSMRKVLADSMVIWGAQEALRQANQMQQQYLPQLDNLKKTVDQSQKIVERMSAQVGFSLLITLLYFLSTLILGILQYRRKSRGLFWAWLSVSIGIIIIYVLAFIFAF